MHPQRRKALEWCRDNGNHLGLPDVDEPKKSLLVKLEREELICLTAQRFRGARWQLTEAGRAALAQST